VIRQVEVEVVDPDRFAEIAGQPHHLLAVSRNEVETLLDGPRQPQRAPTARDTRGAFENVSGRDMQRRLVPFGVQEPRVEPGQWFIEGIGRTIKCGPACFNCQP
jgi:hypothetical protein